ncbi:MAG: hypothetical protein MJ249_07415 [Kiritimatiellae bacterium]|nr:hypothetical protein [Kiritimatiellia bacterium]
MGINGIGNPYNQSSVYGKGELESSTTLVRESNEAIQQGNVVVTEARARVSFAVATPQLADAMNLTFDERQEFIRSFEEKAASATVNLGHKSVMLDIYAVMELIREMGQKLRNAMREMRQCQNQAIQQNLKSQAQMQRETAWCQMIGGAIVGGLQAGASIVGTFKQIGSLNKQAEVGKSLGADMASEQLDMAKVGGQEDLARKQLDSIKKDAPAGIDTGKPLLKSDKNMPGDVKVAREKIATLQQEIAELQGKKGGVEDAVASGKLSEQELASCKDQISKLSGESKAKGAELEKAVADYDQLVEADPARANELMGQYKETIAADRKELADAVKSRDELISQHAQERADLDDSVEPHYDEDFYSKLDAKQAGELKAASQRVTDARMKLVQDYQNASIVVEYGETAKGQSQTHEAMLAEVDGYKQEFESALDRVNNEKRINGKASPKALVELDEARYRYKLARAEQVQVSSTFDKLPPDAHQKAVGTLTNELAVLTDRVNAGMKAGGAEKSAAYGMMIQNASNALLGTLGQKVVEGITQIKQSEITEMQADEKMLEELLDQLKDLFAQDQALIQKALEILQSVISKESQSLEEIINALKA